MKQRINTIIDRLKLISFSMISSLSFSKKKVSKKSLPSPKDISSHDEVTLYIVNVMFTGIDKYIDISKPRNIFTDKIVDAYLTVTISNYKYGMCYYFAKILKDAFPDGYIAWAAPYSHIVYVRNNIAYDASNIFKEYKYLIPEEYFTDEFRSFYRHREDKSKNVKDLYKEASKIMSKYLTDNNIIDKNIHKQMKRYFI